MRFISVADSHRLNLSMAEVVEAFDRGYRLIAEGRFSCAPRSRPVYPPLPPGFSGRGRPWDRDLRVNPGGVEGIGYGVNVGTSIGNGSDAAGSALLFFEWATLQLSAVISDQPLVHAQRSAAPNGVYARHLARSDAHVLALIGSGRIGRLAAEAVCAVRPIDTIRIWSPTPAHREECAAHLRARIASPVPDIRVAADARAAVLDADVVVTAAATRSPVLEGEWLSPGCTVVSNAPEELGADALGRGRLLTIYRDGVLRDHVPPVQGVMDLAAATGRSADDIVEDFGPVLLGAVPGRRTAGEILLCMNSASGVNDAIMGRLVWQRAVELGIGLEVPA